MGKKCTGEQKATRLGVSRHKKRTSKTRVIQREGAKHKIQSRYPALEEGKLRVLGMEESVFFATGRICFDFWFYCCDKLYLAPFRRTNSGEYVPLDQRSYRIHCAVWATQFLLLLHKSWSLGAMLFYEELKVETFMCVSLFLVSFLCFCLSLGVTKRNNGHVEQLEISTLLLKRSVRSCAIPI